MLRQFVIGGRVSLINIAIDALVMTMVRTPRNVQPASRSRTRRCFSWL